MARDLKLAALRGIALGLTLATFATQALLADEEAPREVVATSAVPVATRFFELQIYTAAPGKLDALNKRFRDHTLKFFEKYGIESIGYWTAVDDNNRGKLFYIVGN